MSKFNALFELAACLFRHVAELAAYVTARRTEHPAGILFVPLACGNARKARRTVNERSSISTAVCCLMCRWWPLFGLRRGVTADNVLVHD